ncbi:MAG: ATP-binding protein [Chloroflexota bacterium]|nr:ATP-binding protein [Chloroflexota bacterium]
MTTVTITNPYRPGAGHQPPYLAGRDAEHAEFDRLLDQDTILENMVLTGLRGVGKTVLLDTFKPRAIAKGWGWCGTDLSESVSISEENLAVRLLTDLAVVTSTASAMAPAAPAIGFGASGPDRVEVPVTYDVLASVYKSTPGLVSDKIKAALEFAHQVLAADGKQRVVFAYDEAQNLADHKAKDQFPLSVLLDVFQSLQRKGIPFMLVLTGLPTLFPKLVEARTFAERMFRVVTVGRLSSLESREAIQRPLDVVGSPIALTEESVDQVCEQAGGYPYFIQFICREVYDIFLQQIASGEAPSAIPVDAIQRKLDTDFFAGRWARATDRQRQLLWLVAILDRSDEEFSIQELVAKGREVLSRPFSSSHANQILASLAEQGLIYKNRFGRYSYAVPLLGSFILRTFAPSTEDLASEAANTTPQARL